MDFTPYDRRRYPTVATREGYSQWVRTYEDTVQDEMDLRLLSRVAGVDWSGAGRVLDLACGTGRIGAWLRSHGVKRLDGIDLTPAMLERATAKGLYDCLTVGDITNTKLPDATYDVMCQALADEHLRDLAPLYRETARLGRTGSTFVLVGYHPYFLIANGIPTHFDNIDGKPITIETYVHLFADHVKAALGAGWSLRQLEEGVIDDAWVVKKPKWEKHRGQPVSFCMVWGR